MIHPDRVDEIRARSVGAAWRLSPQERNALAALALSIAFTQGETLSTGYFERCMDVLGDLAPSLVADLRRLTAFVSDLDLQ